MYSGTQNSAALSSRFPVLYEDTTLAIINKPAGIHSSMIPGSDNPSVAATLAEIMPELCEVSSKAEDCGLVNRLDYETSGILIIAKQREVWMALRSSILSDSVIKTYLAVVEGEAPENQKVSNYIGTPNRRGAKVKVYVRTPKKKDRALPAESIFELVKFNRDKDASLVRISLKSGRRHQIRAHAKFIGHSLVGDKLYGSSMTLDEIAAGCNLTFFLHAETVVFEHPESGEEIRVQAPVPEFVLDL